MLSEQTPARTGGARPASEVAAPSKGRYGDGATAGRVAVQVALAADGLAITSANGATITWPYADLAVSEPLRNRTWDAVLTSTNARPAATFHTLCARERCHATAFTPISLSLHPARKRGAPRERNW